MLFMRKRYGLVVGLVALAVLIMIAIGIGL
jgi:hypothetical protein